MWRLSFSLVTAFVDQLERNKCLSAARDGCSWDVANAETATGPALHDALTKLAIWLQGGAKNSCDGPKVQRLSQAPTSLLNTPVP